ncbi:unnamed protein product [Leuciscus chuanchicus]
MRYFNWLELLDPLSPDNAQRRTFTAYSEDTASSPELHAAVSLTQWVLCSRRIGFLVRGDAGQPFPRKLVIVRSASPDPNSITRFTRPPSLEIITRREGLFL